MCRNIKCMQCFNYLLPQWFSALSAPVYFVVCCKCTASRWANRDLRHTAAGSKSPTWFRYDLQLKLDLWPASNHCIRTGVFLGNSFYGERVHVSISCDHVFGVTGNVLWVTLPFYFSIRLLSLCFKDHRGPLLCLLSLWLLGKCWNWQGRVGLQYKASPLKYNFFLMRKNWWLSHSFKCVTHSQSKSNTYCALYKQNLSCWKSTVYSLRKTGRV